MTDTIKKLLGGSSEDVHLAMILLVQNYILEELKNMSFKDLEDRFVLKNIYIPVPLMKMNKVYGQGYALFESVYGTITLTFPGNMCYTPDVDKLYSSREAFVTFTKYQDGQHKEINRK